MRALKGFKWSSLEQGRASQAAGAGPGPPVPVGLHSLTRSGPLSSHGQASRAGKKLMPLPWCSVVASQSSDDTNSEQSQTAVAHAAAGARPPSPDSASPAHRLRKLRPQSLSLSHQSASQPCWTDTTLRLKHYPGDAGSARGRRLNSGFKVVTAHAQRASTDTHQRAAGGDAPTRGGVSHEGGIHPREGSWRRYMNVSLAYKRPVQEAGDTFARGWRL